MTATIIGLLSFFVVIGYFSLCIKILKPEEMGVRVFLGKPNSNKGTMDSGLHFVFFPFEKIFRFKKGRMLFKFRTKTVVTKKGKVVGYEEMEPAELNIDCAIYASFDQCNLISVLENAPGDKTEDHLGPLLVPYAMGAVRALCGRIPWRLINQERQDFAQWIIARLLGNDAGESFKDVKEDKNGNIGFFQDNCFLDRNSLVNTSPFLKCGLKDIDFEIMDVNFEDKEVQAAVSAPEKARLNKAVAIIAAEALRQAAILEGEGNSQKIRLEGKASAEARNEMIQIIKDHPDLEVMSSYVKMAQGTSNTLFLQLPGAFEDGVKKMFGGKGFGEMYNFLDEADRKKVVKYMTELVQGGKK